MEAIRAEPIRRMAILNQVASKLLLFQSNRFAAIARIAQMRSRCFHNHSGISHFISTKVSIAERTMNNWQEIYDAEYVFASLCAWSLFAFAKPKESQKVNSNESEIQRTHRVELTKISSAAHALRSHPPLGTIKCIKP